MKDFHILYLILEFYFFVRDFYEDEWAKTDRRDKSDDKHKTKARTARDKSDDKHKTKARTARTAIATTTLLEIIFLFRKRVSSNGPLMRWTLPVFNVYKYVWLSHLNEIHIIIYSESVCFH